ncbi:hypothetical protein GCM10009789_36430 [Kribbella sancticallisti]|uniref:Oxygen sensor histidine kinase NreB n=1 Tax=Kribbella sancticallisti TaxID=460087 RepID=A0ABN2DKK2_9ACTN
MRSPVLDLGVRTALALGGAGAGGLLLSLALWRPASWQVAAWSLVFVLPLYGVGLLAWSLRPDLPMARLLAVGTSGGSLFSGSVAVAYDLWPDLGGAGQQVAAVTVSVLEFLAAALILTVFLLFPAGRPEGRIDRALLGLVWTMAGVGLVAHIGGTEQLRVDPEFAREEIANPLRVPAAAGLLSDVDRLLDSLLDWALLLVLVVLGVRYLRADHERRAQMRWLFLIPLTALGLAGLGTLLTWADVERAWFWASTLGQYLTLGMIPAVLLVAIVRHRLLDVRVVIRKSLVYGVLWALIAAAYAGVATAVGVAGSQRLPVAAAVVATVLVTVAFNPARARLERLADRLVFGRRVGGHELIARLGRALEGTVDQQELLERLAETVRTGLRAEWAGVRLATGQLATSGRRQPEHEPGLTAALVLRGQELGVIEAGAQAGAVFGDDDARVLDTLAHQVSLAVHNASLTRQLAGQLALAEAQAAEVAASRARIVSAGDAERRRIERDLHDGAQQRVVALMAGLRLAVNQLGRAPGEVANTLSQLEQAARELLIELVEIARGIRPPVLTDHGLPEAIRSRTAKLPIDVELAVDPGADARLPDEIEGAAYFVCTEALTNVLKHAHADRAEVRLALVDGTLRLDVRDAGCGFDDGRGRGSGLANMEDRVTALGGRLTIDSRPGSGTRVRADLPVPSSGPREGMDR